MRVTMQGFIYYRTEQLKHCCKRTITFMILLISLSLSLINPLNLVAERSRPVKIFSLHPLDISLQAKAYELSELKYPEVYGISWRFRWKTIEPREGEYNWELIDKALQVTSNAGKEVMLRVTAGIFTPGWVYQAGVKQFDFSNTDLAHPEHYRETTKMPIPWDEVYLAKWEAFIRAFGRRYNGNPHIYSIQMTGGGHIGEMNLPKAYAKWQQAGYSDEKLIAAWKWTIDAYQKAFPDTPTNLDINEPLGKNRSNVLKPVVSYVLATYPQKVYLQQNALRADLRKDDRIRQVIREASGKTIVGYQMLGGKGFLDQQTGDRLTAFRNAWEDHVSYLEVYAGDVKDPIHRRALQFLAAPIERR